MSSTDPAARIALLERMLERQRAATRQLEKLVEDRTRDLYTAMERVKRQTRLVGASTAIALLSEYGSLELAAPHILREFGEQLDWHVLHLWVRAGVELVCTHTWQSPAHGAPTFAAASMNRDLCPDFVRRVDASARPHWVEDVALDPDFSRREAAITDELHAACAFPIIVEGQVHAVIEMLAHDPRVQDDDLVVTFGALGSQIGSFIERARNREALVRRDRDIARHIQTSLLPRSHAVENLEIAAIAMPAEDVGGDYYDILPFAGGAWLGIGDVSGHGVGAGMIMIMIQSAIAALTRAATSPREVVLGLNHILVNNIRSRMRGKDHATFTLLRYTTDGTVRYAGAHEDLLVYRAATGACELVETPGAWVGVKTGIDAVTYECDLQLEPGDVMLLYTDGLIEARGTQGGRFGMQALVDLFRTLARDTPPMRELCEELVGAVASCSERFDDDVTLVAVRYTPR